MFLVHFTISYALIGYLSIHVHITCIINDLGALGVVQIMQVMGSLQDDKLFTVNSKIWVIQSKL